jgi:beta-lactamase class A
MADKEFNQYNHSYYYSNGHNSPKPVVPKKPKPKRRLRRFFKKLIFILIIAAIVIGVHALFNHHSKKASTSNDQTVPKSQPIKSSSSDSSNTGISSADADTMGQTINTIIEENSGINISVNVIDLSSNNQSFHYGTASSTFQDASTAKIITAEYFLHEVEEGQQSLTETVNGHTAEYELQQMIVVSDDTAWAALNTLLGYNNLQNYADQQFGISDYQAYNNSSSSKDIALALQQLWQGTVLNKSNTQLLLGYLKIANYREYIVPAIPADDTIYHKIGLYQDYVNDATIITHNNQAYVLVVFTDGNGIYNWPARATIMQNIAEATLKAFYNQ